MTLPKPKVVALSFAIGDGMGMAIPVTAIALIVAALLALLGMLTTAVLAPGLRVVASCGVKLMLKLQLALAANVAAQVPDSVKSLAIVVRPGANTLANDFTLSGTCAAILAANASCSFNISFTPQLATALTPNTKTAVVSIPSNASNATTINAITVTGMAIPIPSPIARLSATTLGFGNGIFGSLAPAQLVTLTNVGNLPLNLASITTERSYPQTSTCGAVLAPNATCTISIRFSPTRMGVIPGALVVNSNAPSSPDKVLLSGKGCRYFSPASRFFLTNC